MTQKEQAGLRGPVWKCTLDRDDVYPDHHWVMNTQSTFSAEGNLLEQRHQNPDGSRWSIICRYDDRGRISQEERLGGHHAEGQVLSYHYDRSGRLERVVERSRKGNERVCESYKYEVAGRKVVTVYPDPGFRGSVAVDIESSFESSTDASSIVTFFDDRDRPVKRVFYDPNDRVDRRILMRYDAGGKLVEEGEAEADGRIREDLRHVYHYDSQGRLIEKVMHLSAFGTRRITFTYNEQGFVIEERHQNIAGIVGLGGDEEWIDRFRYECDEHGNWTERVTERIRSTGEAGVSMVERRRLDYY